MRAVAGDSEVGKVTYQNAILKAVGSESQLQMHIDIIRNYDKE